MEENWIQIEGEKISFKETPSLIYELNLLNIFIRKFIEKKIVKNIKVERDEQILFQKRFLTNEGIKDKNGLENWLKLKGLEEKEMNKLLYNNLLLEKFRNDKFSSKVEGLFLKRKTALDRYTYSLIRVKKRDKAGELFLRLQEEEETFTELAASFSEGFEQILDGFIGPMELGTINPIIAEKLLNSTPGQLWPPFEIEGWWAIIRLEKCVPSTLNGPMKNRLINDMYEDWMRLKVSGVIKQLKESEIKNEI